MWFLFGEVSSSSGCLGWATLFYCGTPSAFQIIIFYRRHHELVSKFNVALKYLLHQGLSEPEFNGDLVYNFKKIMCRTDSSDQFRKIIIRHKCIGYDFNFMRQSACLLIKPITVDNFAAIFDCMPMDRPSDSMMAHTSFCFRFSVVLFGKPGISICHSTRCIC